MRILIDMNLSPDWVHLLTNGGFQATHWSTVGPACAADETIMDYARAHDCIVFTHDLDFSAILATSHAAKPSVVQLRTGSLDPNVIGAILIAALRQTQSELVLGALLTIDPHRHRMRLLPLQSTAS
jgi:predicted nuclease of predicted toxin-antitoxin system